MQRAAAPKKDDMEKLGLGFRVPKEDDLEKLLQEGWLCEQAAAVFVAEPLHVERERRTRIGATPLLP